MILEKKQDEAVQENRNSPGVNNFWNTGVKKAGKPDEAKAIEDLRPRLDTENSWKKWGGKDVGRVELCHQEIEVWISIQDNKPLCEPIGYNTRKGKEMKVYSESRGLKFIMS